MKRITSILLALVMTLSVMTVSITGVSAEITTSGGNGESVVTLTVNARNLRVTVPSVLPIEVDSDNNVTVATNAKINNLSDGPIEVTNVSVESQNDWEIVPFNTDFTKVPVDTKKYGMTMYDDDVVDGVPVSLFDVIEGSSELPVRYDGNVAIQSNAYNKLDIGHVVFTVAWNNSIRLGLNDITYPVENTDLQIYLNTSAYDSSDYSYTNFTSSTLSRADRPAQGTIEIPSESSYIIVTDEKTGISFTDSVSGDTYSVENLIPSVVYDYSIYDSSDNVLKSGKIYPTGKVRMINGGASSFNIRDIGGWSADGGIIKYGKIIRGSRLTEASDLELFKNTLGIKSEIDLRLDSEGGVMTGSVLGNDINYTAIPMNTYYKPAVNLSEDTSKIKSAIVQVFNDVKENKPIYIHCWYGADRTATVVFILEALLGMSPSDIDRDYEISSFSNNIEGKTRTNASYSEMVAYFNSFNKGNLRDNVIAWAKKEGILLADINSFRNNMINGSPEQIVETVRLPEEYQEVSYIENTSTAWIDTGITSKYGIRTKVGASITTTGSYQGVIGAYGTSRDIIGYCGLNSWWAAPNAAAAGTNVTLTRNQKYDIDCQRTSDGYLNYGSISAGTNTYLSYTNTVTYGLFARNKGASQDYNFKGKIYYCEIYDGETLVANMIPCYRKVDNKYGMYDIVRNTFYYSSNDVDFTGDD